MTPLKKALAGLLLALTWLAPLTADAASLYIEKWKQLETSGGTPCAGCKLYFYTTGTTTPKDTFSDEALATPNANPITLNSAGRVASQVWISGRYRVVFKTAAGVTISDDDPVEDLAAASDIQDGSATYCGTNSGTADALAFTCSPTLTSYTAGMALRGRITADNTGAVTANFNAVGVKSVLKDDDTALVAGDLQGPDIIEVAYDATTDAFRLLSNSPYLRRTGSNIPARVDVADGATVDLRGEIIKSKYARLVTSTTTITAITLGDGEAVNVLFNTARGITHGASLILPGGVSITTVAGDTATFVGESGGVVRCLHYTTSQFNTRAPRVLGDGAGLNVPADTSEDTLATVTIPASVMGARGTVRITSEWSVNNDASSKTARIRFSGGAGTATFSADLLNETRAIVVTEIKNTTATNVQRFNSVSQLITGATITTASQGSAAVDTTAATTLVFTGQKADSTDTMTLNHYRVELIPSY